MQKRLYPSKEDELIEKVRHLTKSEVAKTISSRMNEFRSLRHASNERVFSELCFCLLTANFSAEGGIRIQQEIGDGFLTLGEEELAKALRSLHHRFPEARAKYIVEARRYAKTLKRIIESFDSEVLAREWLVANIKGLGYKEASHFLRNMGYFDVAILDYHIIDILAKHEIIERPKTLTRKRYLEIERKLRSFAKRLGLSLGELDLYLWFLETGKVLK